MSALQDREPSVLPEMAVESDDFGDAKALHHREAQCVTERVGLVLVVTENGDGACLVILSPVHDLAQAALDMLQEAKSGLSPLPGTVRRIKGTSRAYRGIRHSGKRSPKVDGKQLAQALGADEVSTSTNVDVGSSIDMYALRERLAERLLSTGGRPSLRDASRRQKIPLTGEDWESLERIAEQLSEPGRTITAGQVASTLVHEGLRNCLLYTSPSPRD